VSRSNRKAVWKDKIRKRKEYVKPIRRRIKQVVSQFKYYKEPLGLDVEEEEENPDWVESPLDETVLPNPKTIVNDYDIIDYRSYMENSDDKELKEKYKRK